MLVSRPARSPVNSNWGLVKAVIGLSHFVINVAHNLKRRLDNRSKHIKMIKALLKLTVFFCRFTKDKISLKSHPLGM